MKLFISVFVLLSGLLNSLYSEEYKFEMKGVKASLISEVKSIAPGQKFTVAIYLQHFDGFHTYWKSPGLVGFATSVKWNLPEGFKAGEMQWQVPERSKMLKYNCHAYKGDTYLLVDIQAPQEIPDRFTIAAKVGGMSCSTKECCKIGYIDIGVALAKSSSVLYDSKAKTAIEKARKKNPEASKEFSFKAKRDGASITLEVSGGVYTLDSGLYFYTDENIADTEAEQESKSVEGNLVITFKLNKYASNELRTLKGLLFSEKGWGKTGQQYLPVNCTLGPIE